MLALEHLKQEPSPGRRNPPSMRISDVVLPKRFPPVECCQAQADYTTLPVRKKGVKANNTGPVVLASENRFSTSAPENQDGRRVKQQ
jgi:hypothetical protein